MQNRCAQQWKRTHGKIIELWDVGQAIPAESPNENGMF
jgi:predicted SnoaL-like aldol condensation-catalyzing enzyme